MTTFAELESQSTDGFINTETKVPTQTQDMGNMLDEDEVFDPTKKFRKFPSIVQFNNVVKQVRDSAKWNNVPLPTLTFSGSVKLHGTNSAVGFNPAGEVWFQSRERLLSYESDNAGFCTWGLQNLDRLKDIYEIIVASRDDHCAMYIFGEWFGSNIQKGVALAQLTEKKFGVFQIIIVSQTGEVTQIDPVSYHGALNSLMSNVIVVDAIVPPIEIVIDFSNPSSVQNKLLELTLAIEEECPVGKYFGVSGIGEGIVWTCKEQNLPKMKTKGEKHSASKVKVIHELTDAEIASKANATEFVEYACSENRMRQGIEKLGEMGLPVDVKSMGAYLKWLGGDILTECKDVLIESKIDRKDVMPRIADKARNWFLTYINSNLGM